MDCVRRPVILVWVDPRRRGAYMVESLYEILPTGRSPTLWGVLGSSPFQITKDRLIPEGAGPAMSHPEGIVQDLG